jgi:hypothetical protein
MPTVPSPTARGWTASERHLEHPARHRPPVRVETDVALGVGRGEVEVRDGRKDRRAGIAREGLALERRAARGEALRPGPLGLEGPFQRLAVAGKPSA